MKYIIMCGGQYNNFETPRHLSVVDGEELVARTIRLLRENGVEDIAISTTNPVFEKFGIPLLAHNNVYVINKENKVVDGQWFNAFYPTDEPACYIFGDVFFSPQAIKKIVETDTDDIELFGSKKPFSKDYIKEHEEPFALKVANQKHLREAIEKSRELDAQHKFWRKPIVWELFTVIKNAPLQTKRDHYTTDYVGISDYSVDVDRPEDVKRINDMIGGKRMIKVEAIMNFDFAKFDEIKDTLVRRGPNTYGHINKGDIFQCSQNTAKYLTGDNDKKLIAVKVIEVMPLEADLEKPIKTDVIEQAVNETKKEVKQVAETKPKKSYKSSKKSKKTVD